MALGTRVHDFLSGPWTRGRVYGLGTGDHTRMCGVGSPGEPGSGVCARVCVTGQCVPRGPLGQETEQGVSRGDLPGWGAVACGVIERLGTLRGQPWAWWHHGAGTAFALTSCTGIPEEGRSGGAEGCRGALLLRALTPRRDPRGLEGRGKEPGSLGPPGRAREPAATAQPWTGPSTCVRPSGGAALLLGLDTAGLPWGPLGPSPAQLRVHWGPRLAPRSHRTCPPSCPADMPHTHGPAPPAVRPGSASVPM